MKSADSGEPTGRSAYAYDGEGRRVRVATHSGASVTVFVYDAFGKLVSEYGGAPPQQGGTRYLTQDHLGSTRAITNAAGEVQARHDYFPFGEEIGAGVGGRTQSQWYSPQDGARHGFTGYEKDRETGLDFAQARYYASAQGRFTSPDPLQASAKLTTPQSWNRYTYVLNNPLVYIDPTGELWIASGDTENPYRWVDQCPDGGTCYESVASNVGANVIVYGSQNSTDIMIHSGNEHGMIFVPGLAAHPDARFESAAAEQPNPEEYLNAQTAAALFNAARDYHNAYPNDSEIVMTAGSGRDGEPVGAHESHRNGANIDMRYMGTDGRPLTGDTASATADVNRMATLFTAFGNQNAGLGAALTGDPARFGFGDIRTSLKNTHRNHFHLQRNYPQPPRPARRNR